jgi:hypothetical protein
MVFVYYSLDQGRYWKSTKQTSEKAARDWLIWKTKNKNQVESSNTKSDIFLPNFAMNAFEDYAKAKEVSGNPLGANP